MFALGFLLLYGFVSWSGIVELYVQRWEGTAEQGPREDYAAFLAAGRLVLEGHGHAIYELDAIGPTQEEMFGRPVGSSGVLAFFNPPFVALAFAPLAALSVEAAAALLAASNLVLAAAILVLIVRLVRPQGRTSEAFLVLGILTFFPLTWTVIHGQFSLLLLLGWLGFVLAQVRGDERKSGVWLTVLLIKPQLVVLPAILLAARRQWTALKWFAGVALALAGVSVLVSGPGVIVEYPVFLVDSTGWQGDGISPSRMLGIGGLGARLFAVNSPPYAAFAWGLSIVVVCTLAVIARRDLNSRGVDALPLWAATMMATLLVNPHLYLQDLTLVIGALAVGSVHAEWQGAGLRPWALLASATWFALYLTTRLDPDYALTGCLLMMAVVFIALLRAASRRPVSEICSAPMTAAA